MYTWRERVQALTAGLLITLCLLVITLVAIAAAGQEIGPCQPGQGECPAPCELQLPVWWQAVSLQLDYRHESPDGGRYAYTWETTRASDPGLAVVSLGCCQGIPYRARWYVDGEVTKECWEPGVFIFADGFEEGLGPWQ